MQYFLSQSSPVILYPLRGTCLLVGVGGIRWATATAEERLLVRRGSRWSHFCDALCREGLPCILIAPQTLQRCGECWLESLRSGTRGRSRNRVRERFRDDVFRRWSCVCSLYFHTQFICGSVKEFQPFTELALSELACALTEHYHATP